MASPLPHRQLNFSGWAALCPWDQFGSRYAAAFTSRDRNAWRSASRKANRSRIGLPARRLTSLLPAQVTVLDFIADHRVADVERIARYRLTARILNLHLEIPGRLRS